MIAESKTLYYKERINSANDSQKALFACVKELLHNTKTSRLPEYTSAKELSNRIAKFVKDKVVTIRTSMEEIKKIQP